MAKRKSFEIKDPTPTNPANINVEALKLAGLDEATIQNILMASSVGGTVSVREEEKDPYVEIKGLPSDGKFYRNAAGFPVTIKGMPLKAMDALLLETMYNSGDESLIDDLLRRRIKGVDPKDLILADEIYILAWLREQTFYNSPIRVSYHCDKCDHFNEGQVVTLGDFFVTKCPEHIKSDPHKITLPVSKEAVGLRFMRKRDKLSAKKYLEDISSLKRVTDFDVKVSKVASVIHGMSVKQAIEYFKDMDAIDFTFLYKEYEKMNITFTEVAILKCGYKDAKGECGYTNIVPTPFQSNFFLPEIRSEETNSIESPIS